MGTRFSMFNRFNILNEYHLQHNNKAILVGRMALLLQIVYFQCYPTRTSRICALRPRG